jgi:hypothetical protein
MAGAGLLHLQPLASTAITKPNGQHNVKEQVLDVVQMGQPPQAETLDLEVQPSSCVQLFGSVCVYLPNCSHSNSHLSLQH